MATVIDLLRHLGQHAAPDGGNALAGPVVVPGVVDSPLTLPLPPTLVAAWSRVVGRATFGHHALALSTAQTRHSLALMGHGAAPHADLALLTLSQIAADPDRIALWIVSEDDPGTQHARTIAKMLGIAVVDGTQPGGRIRQAQLVFATPLDLHRRVLHYHDRAWRWLWPRLQVIALPNLHHYTDVRAGHLHWLVRRIERLAPHAPLQILTSLAPVAEVETNLSRLFQRPFRVVGAPDGPNHNTLVTLWRCDADRAASLISLARQLIERRLAVNVLGRDPAETALLQTTLESAGIELAQADGRVALVAGIPLTSDARQTLLRAGYRLLVFLAGSEPHEMLFAADPELLLHALPTWPITTANPYVSASELACAAAERPLEESEIDRWNLRDLRDRLVKRGTLRPLPGSDGWQHAADAGDSYAELDPRSIGGAPVVVLGPDHAPLTTITPALLDRRALPNQVFAPGLRVQQRDEAAQIVQLAADPAERATLVVADMTVTVREEAAARTIRFGKITAELIRGKVLAIQRVTALRELRSDGTQRDLPLQPSDAQWSAAACWIALPAPPSDRSVAGWALTQVLPLLALAHPASLVPAYDAETGRLYLIEAEPGGVGLLDCVYDQFERVVELALALVDAATQQTLFTQLARVEGAWLRVLQSGQQAVPPEVVLPALPSISARAPAPSPQPTSPRMAPLRVVPFAPRARTYTAPVAESPPTAGVPAETAPVAPHASTLNRMLEPNVEATAPIESVADEDAAPYDSVAATVEDDRDAAAAAYDSEPRAEVAATATTALPDPSNDLATVEPSNNVAPAADDSPREVQDRIRPNRMRPQPASAAQFRLEDLLPALDDEAVETDNVTSSNADDDRDVEPEPSILRTTEVEPEPEQAPIEGESSRQPLRPPLRFEPRRGTPPSPQRAARTPDLSRRSAPTPLRQPQDRTNRTQSPRRDQAPPRRDAYPASPNHAPEPQADVNAMIARMRRLREQREAEQAKPVAPARPAASFEPAELRFHIGERVQCLPYGIGIVRGSSVVAGREQVVIDFPEYGEIEVDPAVNLVRSVARSAQRGDDDGDRDASA